MKQTKVWSVLVALLIVAVTIAGCGNKEQPSASGDSSSPGSSASSSDTPAADAGNGTYRFTDSSGREVELPETIDRIAPSGPLAQIVLYTLCPDKLVGLASDITDEQFSYIGEGYRALPVFGNFYADTLNLESVMTADPQIIIDIGEPKENIADDMNGVQEKTGIPTIFVQMEMDSMISAYQTLGEITGEAEQAQKLIDYIDQTRTDTAEKVAGITEDDRVKVYYGQDAGLTAVVAGTVHSDVIDAAGGINVVDLEESIRGGAADISMEQLMLWAPDVVLLAPASIYDTIATQPEWQGLSAVTSGQYYEIPEGPYNWMGRPPSVNRILGIKWLSNLLYPEVFDYDMEQEVRTFYELFYHCDVTDEQIEGLLAKATAK